MRIQRFIKGESVKSILFWLPIFLLLLLAGARPEIGLYIIVGGITVSVYLLFLLIDNKRVNLPKGFPVYSLFLLLFLLSLFWSHDWGKSLGHLLNFTAGGVFWVVAYNQKNRFEKGFNQTILFLGIVFGAFAIANRLFGFIPFGRSISSLVLPYTGNHHHIGDFWAVVLTVVIYYVFVNRRKVFALLFIPGIYLLALSLSRSAYLALAVGIFYIFYRKGWVEKYKKILAVSVLVLLVLLVFAGTKKTILVSRPYFIQSLLGLVKYPFGVGVGNFKVISLACTKCKEWGFGSFSSNVHNIALEMLSGMGILGFSFVTWLYVVVKDVLDRSTPKNLIYAVVFLVLLANFLFDSTYYSSTMLWLFFLSLGIAQKEKEKVPVSKYVLLLLPAFLITVSILVRFGVFRISL